MPFFLNNTMNVLLKTVNVYGFFLKLYKYEKAELLALILCQLKTRYNIEKKR